MVDEFQKDSLKLFEMAYKKVIIWFLNLFLNTNLMIQFYF
jgi:hypothetical protein